MDNKKKAGELYWYVPLAALLPLLLKAVENNTAIEDLVKQCEDVTRELNAKREQPAKDGSTKKVLPLRQSQIESAIRKLRKQLGLKDLKVYSREGTKAERKRRDEEVLLAQFKVDFKNIKKK